VLMQTIVKEEILFLPLCDDINGKTGFLHIHNTVVNKVLIELMLAVCDVRNCVKYCTIVGILTGPAWTRCVFDWCTWTTSTEFSHDVSGIFPSVIF